MHTFQTTVTIARPVGEVFAFMADLRNIPRWNYAIARTVPTSPGGGRGGRRLPPDPCVSLATVRPRWFPRLAAAPRFSWPWPPNGAG